MSDPVDLLVIGGGINGAGIARDAAGRGLSVMLVEKDDLASHTSSASTKLVHGGLRYLEHYEFRLVGESLREREVLLANAPHIIWPLRFVLPHEPGMRPKWMLRLGLALYDRLGGKRSLPASHAVKLNAAPHRAILQDRLVAGFEYSDCWVDDARLVVLTAMDAAARGAQVLTRTECVGLERGADHWQVQLRDADGKERLVQARALVNAAGPWVDQVAKQALGAGTPAHLRLVKGSHIIVPRAYPGEHAYIFQQPDGRIIFAIPYERDFTLIGTTDLLYDGDLDRVAISAAEVDYLRDAASRYLRSGISPQDVVHSYAGVRPLYEDNSSSNSTVTRDYVFEVDAENAPILSVYGGKITTYRKLAEHALEKLANHLPIEGQPWTAHASLPGGDIPDANFTRFFNQMADQYPWMPSELLHRLTRSYGTRIETLIGPAQSLDQLGYETGGGIYEAELRYLVENEFARTPEDVLWRRSKLGLHTSAETRESLAKWFADRA